MENATDLELEALRSVPFDLEAGVARINAVLLEALPAFRQALDAENVPWTPGRPVGS